MSPSTAIDTQHTTFEDVYAIFIGSSLCGLGVVLLHTAGLVTGGAAGIALIASYVTGISVGALFFAINVPFLILGQRILGWKFAFKSVATVILLSLFTFLIPRWQLISKINPIFASIFGGTLLGMGILSLARHKSSVGGIGVLALYLHENHGVNAGKTQGVSDILIVSAALVAIDVRHVALSVASALALSAVIFVYHKPGRYTGY